MLHSQSAVQVDLRTTPERRALGSDQHIIERQLELRLDAHFRVRGATLESVRGGRVEFPLLCYADVYL